MGAATRGRCAEYRPRERESDRASHPAAPPRYRPRRSGSEQSHRSSMAQSDLQAAGALASSSPTVFVRHTTRNANARPTRIRSSFSTTSEATALRRLYSGIPSTSFSQEVMSMRPSDLAVLCATGLGWSDLGEPGRVLSVPERKAWRRSGDSNRAASSVERWQARKGQDSFHFGLAVG